MSCAELIIKAGLEVLLRAGFARIPNLFHFVGRYEAHSNRACVIMPFDSRFDECHSFAEDSFAVFQ